MPTSSTSNVALKDFTMAPEVIVGAAMAFPMALCWIVLAMLSRR